MEHLQGGNIVEHEDDERQTQELFIGNFIHHNNELLSS